MPWWDDVLKLLRDEFGSADTKIVEPESAKQAEALLKRTAREITTAKARAEAARRRLLRAQDELHALTQKTKAPQTPLQSSYRERLTDLAKAIAHESDLVEAFDAHIQRLNAVQAKVEHEASKFERDRQMARTAHVTASTSQHVPESPPNIPAHTPAGFRRTFDKHVLDQLKAVSKKDTASQVKPKKPTATGAKDHGKK
jgi:DNA repair exonuclease SbcCD ATPase subunit